MWNSDISMSIWIQQAKPKRLLSPTKRSLHLVNWKGRAQRAVGCLCVPVCNYVNSQEGLLSFHIPTSTPLSPSFSPLFTFLFPLLHCGLRSAAPLVFMGGMSWGVKRLLAVPSASWHTGAGFGAALDTSRNKQQVQR